jgi:hypothetical protein
MKKQIIFCLLLAFALILFISCTNTNTSDNGATPDTPANANNPAPGEIILEDLYFFRFDVVHHHGISPIKINPVTQTVSFICTDPLCSHAIGSDCPLEGITAEVPFYFITGNHLFFSRDGIVREGGRRFGSIELLVYDMLNGTLRKLTEYTDRPANNLAVMGYGHYLFYAIAHLNELDNGIIDRFVYYRADAVTGEIIELPLYGEFISDSIWDYPMIWEIIEDKIYWWARPSPQSRTLYFYTTDLDGGNQEIIEQKDAVLPSENYHNGYLYALTTTMDMPALSVLVPGSYEELRADMDKRLTRRPSGSHFWEDELIAENVISFRLHGDKIYLMFLEDEPEPVEINGEAVCWNWSGGKIWVMNLDGTDKRLLADTGNLGVSYGFLEVKTINGIDYIAVSFNIIAEDDPLAPSGHWRIPSPDTIIINGSTGEWVVLSAPE